MALCQSYLKIPRNLGGITLAHDLAVSLCLKFDKYFLVMLIYFKINLIIKALFMKIKTTFIKFIIISSMLFTPIAFINEKSLNLDNQEKAKASLKLGWMYFNGEGVQQDYKKAFMSFKESAERGNAKASWEVAKMYLTGVGVTEDSKNAKVWLKKSFIRFEEAGLQGDGHASRKIAERYQWGVTVERNIEKAVMWFEKADEQGDVRALLGLGVLYLYGLGLTDDTEKAYKLFKKAAELGNTKAQFIMGNRYYHGRHIFRGYRDGRDIIQDYEKAYRWYKKAAEQGSTSSHEYLAIMYKKGLGVTKNYRTALKYFYLSRYLGNNNTRFLPKLKFMESIMTDVEIERAKQLADGWMEDHKQVSILKARCSKIKALMTDAIKNGLSQAVPTHNEFGVNIGCGWE